MCHDFAILKKATQYQQMKHKTAHTIKPHASILLAVIFLPITAVMAVLVVSWEKSR